VMPVQLKAVLIQHFLLLFAILLKLLFNSFKAN
jgi:hypothetical protein